jgi:RNA exonuclease 1
VLSLPPLPTSATENSNLPVAIPLPPGPPDPPPMPSSPPELPFSVNPRSEEAAALYGGIPFVARTFPHACPTRAPGARRRREEEKTKRRLQERVAGLSVSRDLIYLSS